MDLSRRWRTLLRKVEYLRLELDEVKETLSGYERDFSQRLSKITQPTQPQQSSEATIGTERVNVVDQTVEQPTPKPEELESQDDRPESFKKLWRMVATASHPDATNGDSDLEAVYKRAVEAWRTGKFEGLIDAAAELGIDVPDPDPAMVRSLQRRCDSLEGEINKYTKSPLWMWGSAPDDKKDEMVRGVAESKKG